MRNIFDFARAIKAKFDIVESCFQTQLDSNAKKCIIGKEGNNPETEEKTRGFHTKADEFTEILVSLQGLVKLKIGSIDRSAYSNDDGPMKFESDPDGSATTISKPVWLSALIGRYYVDLNLLQEKGMDGEAFGMKEGGGSAAVASLSSSSSSSLSQISQETDKDVNPPLGSFCAYLSFCVTEGIHRLSDKEANALYDVVHASVTHDSQTPPPPEERPPVDEMQKLWSRRFYNFLKKLSELKTALRDEKSLLDIQKYAALLQL